MERHRSSSGNDAPRKRAKTYVHPNPNRTSFRIPFLFLNTGLALFAAFHLLALASGYGWLDAHHRSPGGWAAAHLLVLGWATMTAMGAAYQLLYVVLQTKLHSEGLAYVHYAVYALGTVGLVLAFRAFSPAAITAFGALAACGIALFAWNLARTLLHARQWNTITLSTAGALACLVLAALIGVAMGASFWLGAGSALHARLFVAHLWLGAIGWFGLLITGYTYKLLPMFYLAHGYPRRLEGVVLLLWSAAVLVGALGALAGGDSAVQVAALFVLVLAMIAFVRHIAVILRHRHKANPGVGIACSVWSARSVAVAAVLALLVAVFYPQTASIPRTAHLAGAAYLWGWVGFTILGYLSKIVPFLWWTHKYGPKVGKEPVPSLAELLNDRLAGRTLAVMALAFLLFMAALAAGWTPLAKASGMVLSLAALGYTVLLATTFMK
ncbi:MAG TPA: hypothetical protein VIK75_05080 [Calditerricola sp.]